MIEMAQRYFFRQSDMRTVRVRNHDSYFLFGLLSTMDFILTRYPRTDDFARYR